MSQNVSSAVMAQRREPHDSLDFFPTPPWATRALCVYLSDRAPMAGCIAWDPACGQGHMVRPLDEYFDAAIGTDVHDYGCGYQIHDFLMPYTPIAGGAPEWIVTNPPFRLADQFVVRALELANVGVAMFVRAQFLEGDTRFRQLFSRHRPALILQFTERVILAKGIVRDPAVKYWNEKKRRWQLPSSATAYCWVIWQATEPAEFTRYDWIPKCRKRLERPGDYSTQEVA